MQNPIDRFSDASQDYRKYRPVYPDSLFEEVLQWVPFRGNAWDCGTGNGQVASVLAKSFKWVDATDLSEAQLAQATQMDNVRYQVARSEQTPFRDHQFDLITVAQAVHWFDIEAFEREINRVAKPGAVLAIWGYGLLRVSAEIDHFIGSFYRDIIGPYWDPQRSHIDDGYSRIRFGFRRIGTFRQHQIQVRWSFSELLGYLNSWSSVKKAKKLHPTWDPVSELSKEIKPFWSPNSHKPISFPIFVHLWKIDEAANDSGIVD
ncbi:class I SAM-dependent methyltransferase [Pontibacter sp. G13]|uniref:class I SAM-dependent methyltransferase n=1 Tax=Pontibacter sp. G13 TaxID=3074898 RepID=UPI00288A05A6|nr:class I SAM-dependent methyltransferase [Pontibacter sp. G13]WNJ17853.1 class I SAM-dependent methyltransferase [Pontibacter sp. G13]